jgi:hypothetical protein
MTSLKSERVIVDRWGSDSVMKISAPCSHLWEEARKRERVRCSSLVDWPVYPRLSGTMPASTRSRIAHMAGADALSASIDRNVTRPGLGRLRPPDFSKPSYACNRGRLAVDAN